MTYQEYKRLSAARINDLPIFFAFSYDQFKAGMEKLGLNPDDTSSVCKIGGGGFMKKADTHLLKDAIDANEKDRESVIADDAELMAAIVYELGNHEYCITHDTEPTCRALGIDLSDERISLIFDQARKEYWSQVVGCNL